MTKQHKARDIMSDEAWDMVWEGLKEYCKINGMSEEYIKYDNYFRSQLIFTKLAVSYTHLPSPRDS